MLEDNELQRFKELMGPVVLSRRGDILIAENDFILMAYAPTEDKDKIGTDGLFQDTYVTFISRTDAERWKDV